MANENKPNKKELSFSEIVEMVKNPGAAITKLFEDPDNIAKIPETLAKFPPEAKKALAQSIAEYLPPPQIEIDEIAQATARIMMPLLKDEVAKMTPGSVDLDKVTAAVVDQILPVIKEQISKIPPVSPENLQQIADKVTGSLAAKYAEENAQTRDELTKLASTLKTIQDSQITETKVRELTSVTFQAELEAARKAAAEEQVKREREAGGPGGPAANPNPGVEEPPKGGYGIAMGIVDKLLEALPTIADAYSKFRPAPSQTVAQLSDIFKWHSLLTKIEKGNANADDIAGILGTGAANQTAQTKK